jgi:hypothetical protein
MVADSRFEPVVSGRPCDSLLRGRCGCFVAAKRKLTEPMTAFAFAARLWHLIVVVGTAGSCLNSATNSGTRADQTGTSALPPVASRCAEVACPSRRGRRRPAVPKGTVPLTGRRPARISGRELPRGGGRVVVSAPAAHWMGRSASARGVPCPVSRRWSWWIGGDSDRPSFLAFD